MITSKNLIETVIALRMYVWDKGDGTFNLYESLPEDGEGVKKKLGSFKSREELDTFREEYAEQLRKHLESIINVKPKSSRRRPVDHPTSREVKKKVKCASLQSTSKQADSIPTVTESSSSERSMPTSPEALNQSPSKDGSYPTTSPGTPTA